MLRSARLAWYPSAIAALTSFTATSVRADAPRAPAAASASVAAPAASASVAAPAASVPVAAPEANEPPPRALVELGFFGGAIFPSADHALIRRGTHEAFESAAPEIGVRAALLALPNLGIEAEGAAMPTHTASGGGAGLWAARAHVIASFTAGRITPFALLGAGALGAGSNSMGSDTDPAFHFGLGTKLKLDDFLAVRLDVRDTLSQKFAASQGEQTHHPEILLGLSFALGAAKAPPPEVVVAPADTDKDGIVDSLDKCPTEAASTPDGCPIKDSDADGVFDDKDACPTEPGKAPCGCPFHDADGDKVIDELDKCPDVPGPIEGCPDPDADHDGIVGADDKCPDKPETKNGFEDTDGCPDEVPEKIKKFTGVIKGIEFDLGKETIRPQSFGVLDGAAFVLTEYPALRVLVTGHTDDVGNRDKNLDLSQKRANSVKAYFVEKKIAENRIETRGAGPDEPIADNKTAAGRQKNRRIEFKLLEK